jgi:hypothetical protein
MENDERKTKRFKEEGGGLSLSFFLFLLTCG